MTELDRSENDDLLLALRHPLRRQILLEMEDVDDLSPRELSTALEQPLSNVSYHVRVLADCGAVILVGTREVRGSMQHFYATAIEEPWARQALGLDPDDGHGAPGETSTGSDT